MDSTTLLIIVGVILFLVAMYFFNRNRPTAPRGTYDDKNYQSGGSIGGGQRTYDDPDFRSGGSIGGTSTPSPRASAESSGSGSKTYDDDRFKSGGSIGG
jgi:hypothetical protein